ncbi:DUF4261 domain-containing protein [Novipirellula sp. SH528]|uniref:DUF4261 domain-containing protein n=1 Tax=Novipirellula sp. SH528 TaxID=3454466 RepID=UPI003F9F5EF5
MSMQMAELHYTSTPSYDAGEIVARAEELLGSGIESPTSDSGSGSLLFFHKNHSVQYKDGAVPPQTAILATDKSTDPAAYADRVQQSWFCDDAAERIRASKCSRLVTELMAGGLEPAERIRLFHGVLQAFVEVTEPQAIAFGHSQQIVAADAYLKSCSMAPIQRLGSLNVRFFSISNSDAKDMIMDTRGLDEIGLHDLQCHFRGLDPNKVSQLLLDTGLYIFENGSVIESGQTVAGTEPDSKWGCQFEDSLLEPKRELLDLNPGAPYAAGGR